MTGLSVTDKEIGKSVTIPLSAIETATVSNKGNSGSKNTSAALSTSINLDLITSDQYTQAYLEHLFSKGPVAELENYFMTASDNLRTLKTKSGLKKTEVRHGTEQSDGLGLKDQVESMKEEQRESKGKEGKEARGRREEMEEEQGGDSLKLSIVETQPDESSHSKTDT